MASRFWVAQPVSGAVVSVASPPQIRLTVSSTTGMTNGDTRTVFGVGGTTEANGTWTITVIDSTHIDLQGTTFTNVYTSGGSVYGLWDGSNTNNWVSTTGGTNYGQTVPGASDTVTLDGSSGGGTIIPNATLNINTFTFSAFTGTLDLSIYNNNITSISFTNTASATKTIKMGNGTWASTGTVGAAWNWGGSTGTTLVCGSSTLSFTGTFTTFSTIQFGSNLTYATVNISAQGAFGVGISASGCTFGTLNITAPCVVDFMTAMTITNAFSWTGSSSNALSFLGNNVVLTVAGGSTISWGCLSGMNFSTTVTATNSLNAGGNTNATITAPAGGGGGHIIGG